VKEFVRGDIIAINQNKNLFDSHRGIILTMVTSISPARYWIYIDKNDQPIHFTEIGHTYPATKINKVLYPDYVEYEGRLIPKGFL
jgi:hypothetical protein